MGSKGEGSLSAQPIIYPPILSVRPSNHPSIHISIQSSIYSTTHQSIPYIHPFFTVYLPGTLFHLQTHSISQRCCLLIQPSHLSHPSIHQPIHLPSVHPSVHLYAHPLIHLPSMHLSTIYPSINESIYLPSILLNNHPPILLPTQPPNHTSIHPIHSSTGHRAPTRCLLPPSDSLNFPEVLSTHPSTSSSHLSHPSIHPPSMYPSIHQSLLTIYPSKHLYIHPYVQLSTIHPSSIHLPTHPSTTRPPIYPIHTFLCCSLSIQQIRSLTFKTTHFIKNGAYSLLPATGSAPCALPTPMSGPLPDF